MFISDRYLWCITYTHIDIINYIYQTNCWMIIQFKYTLANLICTYGPILSYVQSVNFPWYLASIQLLLVSKHTEINLPNQLIICLWFDVNKNINLLSGTISRVDSVYLIIQFYSLIPVDRAINYKMLFVLNFIARGTQSPMQWGYRSRVSPPFDLCCVIMKIKCYPYEFDVVPHSS